MAPPGGLARILPALLDARRDRRSRGLDAREIARLGKAVGRLSAGFTGERALVGTRYLDDDALFDGYLLFYFPITYAKALQALAEVPGLPARARALDLGSGPGPGALALSHRVGDGASVVAADREVAALGALRALWTRLGAGELSTLAWQAPRPLPPRVGAFDVILAANLLNELFVGDARREARLAGWLSELAFGHLAEQGHLVLLEPALRETSRALLSVRDRLVETGMRVRAPCLTQGPCPARVKPTDWCHAARAWEAPAWVRQIAGEARIDVGRIGFSYLVLTRGAVAKPVAGAVRVVSDPLEESGKRKIWVCGTLGRAPLTLLDKHASAKNSDFAALERGDVVRVSGVRSLAQELRLDADSEVVVRRRPMPGDAPGPHTKVVVVRPD